ncbi:hypothetical protein OPT61_g6434 [Boeremia exigua]|uniref:Uncharacterized protein n=1 Tax=Boeremia exigua TaxID=749465 RepID=A0ACC2I6L9_9PLEO|nr:hypothetical protein OPT61_g6434 [Boeremia exigua]
MALSSETPVLPDSFFQSVQDINDTNDRLRWYMCVLVFLSSVNYPDVIPQVYTHLDTHLLSRLDSDEARKAAISRVREGLIKSTGIVGAARTGNAMRTLSNHIPESLREKESLRAKESEEEARERGRKFWLNVYARNPAFDPEASVRASPDYAFVVRDVLYARVFSFDGILDDLTTGYAMVSGLYGLDCQNQLQHHMKGMLWNGASREDLMELQKLCLTLTKILGIRHRNGPAPIPVLPDSTFAYISSSRKPEIHVELTQSTARRETAPDVDLRTTQRSWTYATDQTWINSMLTKPLSYLVGAALTSVSRATQHGLIVGNFVQGSLYSVTFDSETFELELVANTSGPGPSSWLSFSHDKKNMYGTNYVYVDDQVNRTTPPEYFSYTVNNLTSITHTSTLAGKKRCNGSSIYIEALPVPPYTVYGFDYWGTPGCGQTMSVDDNGALKDVIQNYNYWPESGIHGSAFSKDHTLLYAADTLGNAIWTQPINKTTGALGKPIDIRVGPSEHADPRHVVLHTSGNALYAVMEGANEMGWYEIDNCTQFPVLRGLFPLLPEELLNSTNHWANEVAVSPSGKYIWSTTRGRGGNYTGFISVFEADTQSGDILRQNFLRPTLTSGGVANVVVPSEFDDGIVALTDNAVGFLEIWRLQEDAMWAEPVSRITLSDQGNARYASGCCANAVTGVASPAISRRSPRVLPLTSCTMTDAHNLDAVIVGAGFGGVYQLKKLREAGYHVKLLESGSNYGGVWYWNRYPGARVDSAIPHYEFSDPELWRDWSWTERFPGSAELRKYFAHVDEKWDLRRDTVFDCFVERATWDDGEKRWQVSTGTGLNYTAKFLLLNTGFAAKRYIPTWEGIDRFKELCGIRIAVIGTGSTGVQLATELAKVAGHLIVFQRTPNMALPMKQVQYDPPSQALPREQYPGLFTNRKESFSGFSFNFIPRSTFADSPEQRREVYEGLWAQGDFHFWLATYADMLFDRGANEEAYAFWRGKTLARVDCAKVAEMVAPEKQPHAFGCKRVSLEDGFFEIFNQENVTLVDVGKNGSPIERITARGVQTGEREYEVDVIVCATGFDAFTGGLTQIDIRGRDGASLKETWKDGVKTYMGMASHGFPNMFFTYGPQAPTAFCNGPTCAELQGEWILKVMEHARQHGLEVVEAQEQAQQEWKELVCNMAHASLLPTVDSWYMGANVPGKLREPLVYVGGVPRYSQTLDEVAEKGYAGFALA